MSKVCNTEKLRYLNRDAVKRGYNRAIADGAIAKLDSNGYHVASIVLFHNDTEFRCRVLMKFENDNTPHEVWLDIAPDEWNKLTGAKSVADSVK